MVEALGSQLSLQVVELWVPYGRRLGIPVAPSGSGV